MKLTVRFVIVSLFLIVGLDSCDFIRDMFPSGKSDLTFKAILSSGTKQVDSVLFTGNDINWINGTTGEISFNDSTIVSKIRCYHFINCYIGSDSLFRATITIPIMSSVENNLVLNLNLKDNHFYFEDGYPDWIDNNGANGIRIQNKEKRFVGWDRFIRELKKEGRYKE